MTNHFTCGNLWKAGLALNRNWWDPIGKTHLKGPGLFCTHSLCTLPSIWWPYCIRWASIAFLISNRHGHSMGTSFYHIKSYKKQRVRSNSVLSFSGTSWQNKWTCTSALTLPVLAGRADSRWRPSVPCDSPPHQTGLSRNPHRPHRQWSFRRRHHQEKWMTRLHIWPENHHKQKESKSPNWNTLSSTCTSSTCASHASSLHNSGTQWLPCSTKIIHIRGRRQSLSANFCSQIMSIQ